MTEKQDVERTIELNRSQSWEIEARSLWGDAFRRLVRSKTSLLGLGIFMLFVFAAIFGLALSPYDYLRQDLYALEQGPSWAHPFGTDELGRDFLTRIIAGARTALFVGVFVTILQVGSGVLIGATAAYLGGWIDTLLMWTVDTILSFPHFLLAVFINATLENPIEDAMIAVAERTGWQWANNTVYIDYVVVFGALAMVGWGPIARLVRGQILSLRAQDFILSAEAVGVRTPRIVLRHLLPNALGPVIVAATAGFGSIVLAESSLSFLGIGIQPPGASWGAMITENMGVWRERPHLVAVPGITLSLIVFAANFLGDGLNDALNPRSRQ
ncbi:MAG: ABC transporter permease [Caldilineaceae bacterium]|nr:ABC transporter permease [Caldilineaceae bacterium]